MDAIAIYLPGIILAYSAFLLAIASPGPNVLAVIGTAMSVGRRSGLALALGVAAGSFCWAVLATYAAALVAIKIAGGLYLLFLAYKAFRAAASAQDIAAKALAGATRSALGYLAHGFTVQMTNPKALLAWIAIISLGLTEGAPLWVGLSIVAGTTILSIAIHCLYALAFSTPRMVHLYARARRAIQAALGACFAFAGIKLLTSR